MKFHLACEKWQKRKWELVLLNIKLDFKQQLCDAYDVLKFKNLKNSFTNRPRLAASSIWSDYFLAFPLTSQLVSEYTYFYIFVPPNMSNHGFRIT